MSTLEEKVLSRVAAPVRLREGVVARFLRFACSVRLGVVLLCLLGIACVIGMLIMQQNVDGFENYYSSLTPAQRLLYGKLDFFNIYHAWYFNALLCLLSLNIILASVDRFPKTWRFASNPQVRVPMRWLNEQELSATLETRGSDPGIRDVVTALVLRCGWRRIHVFSEADRTYLLGESGVWNRFGAYAVHVALLTIFLGGFLTAQLSTSGSLTLAPGESSDMIRENVVELDRVSEIAKKLPFDVRFIDIEQRLIRDDGSLSAANTLDWITRFEIQDGGNTIPAVAQMNKPFDYRGYRFFQSSFVSIGRARNITVVATPVDGSPAIELKIDRDGAATLRGGTLIRFSEFRANFRIGPEDPNEDTSGYPNPAAVLQIVPPGETMQMAYALPAQMANIPIASKPVGGYTFQLADFERVSDRHVLSIQHDPGSNVVYAGFALLFVTLTAVFFFSHERIWIVFEQRSGEDGQSILVAGHTNRNHDRLERRFHRFVADVRAVISNSDGSRDRNKPPFG